MRLLRKTLEEDFGGAYPKHLRKKFDIDVGLSDHTLNNLAAITAVGLGAVAIEKHFKLDESECGPDSSFSLTPTQLSQLVSDSNGAWLARGNEGFFRADVESENKVFILSNLIVL